MLIHSITEPATEDCRATGLQGLAQVALNQRNQGQLDCAASTNGGQRAWQRRKLAEAHDLLALSQIAPADRLWVSMLDLRHELRAILRMRVPVPCRPTANNVLPVADLAWIGLVYPPQVVRECLPGTSFVQIFEPRGVWHAQVAAHGQVVCLGDRLPRNIPAPELVILTYATLAMTIWQVDERDEAGVMNGAAATWWAANLHRMPLSETPFLVAADIVNKQGRPAGGQHEQANGSPRAILGHASNTKPDAPRGPRKQNL